VSFLHRVDPIGSHESTRSAAGESSKMGR